jgi:hypothetical protein
MANVAKLIFGAAIAVASISTPTLAAHKREPTSNHNGYVTRSSQGSGVYNFAPVAPRSAGVLPPEQQCGSSCDPYGHAITGGN